MSREGRVGMVIIFIALTAVFMVVLINGVQAATVQFDSGVVVDGANCASRTLEIDQTGARCAGSTPTGGLNRIAVAGCSQTRYWVGDKPGITTGYDDTWPDLFADASYLGGGTIDRWIDPSQPYMDGFRTAVAGQNIDAILLQVCIRTKGHDGMLSNLITQLKSIAGNVPVYLQPLDVSLESAGCEKAGYDKSVTLVNNVINAGLALRGPALYPPYQPHEVLRDNCHPNNAGVSRQVETVRAWYEGVR